MTSPTPRLYVPGASQMSVKINQVGQEAVVVLGAGTPSGNTAMTPAKALAWLNAFWGAFRPLVVGTASCTGATVRDVGSAEGTVIEVPPPTNPTGSGGSAVAVASASTLVKWSTARGGRSGKGRTYVPGLSYTAVSDTGRAYTAAHQAATATAIQAYLTAGVFDVSFTPIVISFRRGYGTPITGGSLAAVVGTQRRRMR